MVIYKPLSDAKPPPPPSDIPIVPTSSTHSYVTCDSSYTNYDTEPVPSFYEKSVRSFVIWGEIV